MVLHRDLKPANLLIGGIHASRDNTAYVAARYGLVKVADFGLSRVTTLLQADLTPAAVRSRHHELPQAPATSRPARACRHGAAACHVQRREPHHFRSVASAVEPA